MTQARGAGDLEQLVLANRILFQQGIVDGYGHVSIRDPADPGRFFQARNIAPAFVTERDVLVHDLDGHVLSGEGDPALERFIHGAIYAVRPDVGAKPWDLWRRAVEAEEGLR